MENKTNKIIYWVFTILIAFIFASSGLMKLFAGDKAAEMAQGVGGTTNLMILGIIELAIVALWFIPRTGVVASLLAMAYLGGAIAVHLTTGKSVLVPVIIESLVWIAAAYRFPELKQRLFS